MLKLRFRFKCLVVCVLLLLLAHGRLHFYHADLKEHFDKFRKEQKVQEKLDPESDDELLLHKRKARSKGIQVGESQLLSSSFDRSFVYYLFSSNLSSCEFVANTHRAHRKRGPPAA